MRCSAVWGGGEVNGGGGAVSVGGGRVGERCSVGMRVCVADFVSVGGCAGARSRCGVGGVVGWGGGSLVQRGRRWRCVMWKRNRLCRHCGHQVGVHHDRYTRCPKNVAPADRSERSAVAENVHPCADDVVERVQRVLGGEVLATIEEDVVDLNGEDVVRRAHFTAAGVVSRTDGPAIEWFSQSGVKRAEAWLCDGQRHRDDGEPAMTLYDDDGSVVECAWYRHGKRHRDDGPAVVRLADDGRVEGMWWVDGKRLPADRSVVVHAGR